MDRAFRDETIGAIASLKTTANTMTDKVDNICQSVDRVEDRVNGLEVRVAGVEHRMEAGFSAGERRFDQIEHRFDRLENKLDSSIGKITQMLESHDERVKSLEVTKRSQVSVGKWIAGVIGTVIAAAALVLFGLK
jgi:hypothetical protein